MKQLKTTHLISGLLLAALIVGAGMFLVIGPLLSSEKPGIGIACAVKGLDHQVEIQEGRISPSHITATLCDTLTIVNNDSTDRLIAFGQHDKHVAYDGVLEKNLTQGNRFTVTLNKPGTYLFHDHFHEEVQAEFTVTK